MKTKNKNKGFTLIELVVVVAIVAILATIAFISFGSYTSSSRDFKRMNDISMIKASLNTYQKNMGGLLPGVPTTSSGVNINSGTITPISLAVQTYFDSSIGSQLNMPKIPMDPRTNNYYIYSVTADKTKYQISATLEDIGTKIAFVEGAYAATCSNDNKAYIDGNFVYQSGSNLPGLIYATGITYPKTSLDVITNAQKVVLSGQNLNIAYDMGSSPKACGANLAEVKAGSNVVVSNSPSIQKASCGALPHGSNDAQALSGSHQHGWQYKTCDNGSWVPAASYNYSCENLPGAIFTTNCTFNGCQTPYTQSGSTDSCKYEQNNVILSYPSNGAYNLPKNLTFSWYPVTGVTSYKFYLGTANGTWDIANGVGTGSTEVNYSVSNLGTTYYWKITDSAGIKSSEVRSFTTLPDMTVSGGSSSSSSSSSGGGTATYNPYCPPGIVCNTNSSQVDVTFVGCSNTSNPTTCGGDKPASGKDSFGALPRDGNNFYGKEGMLSYKINNQSDGQAKFKVQLRGLKVKSYDVEDVNDTAGQYVLATTVAEGYDGSTTGKVIDIGKEGISNNVYWVLGQGQSFGSGDSCWYDSTNGYYVTNARSTCYVTVYGRSDSGISASDQDIAKVLIQNVAYDSTTSNWQHNGGVARTLSMRSTGFSATALSINYASNSKQTGETSTDATTDNFGTSTRIDALPEVQGFGYRKSLTYTVQNTNTTTSYFKTYIGGGTGSLLQTGRWMTPNVGDVNSTGSFLYSDTRNVFDIGLNSKGNIIWKNGDVSGANACATSPSGTSVGNGFMVPASSSCQITLYLRGELAVPADFTRALINLKLQSQPIADYTYNPKYIYGKANGWSFNYTNYVQSETMGRMKLNLTTVGYDVYGYAESETEGWVCFDATCGASITRNPATGQLTGYAQSEVSGWIKVDQVYLKNATDSVSGYGESETAGRIFFGP